uniref:Uncharacterized protein n=1 Tax=Paenibacillus alginolyticus TaxID=59839 RepID=Q9F8Q7_9BACL|nr:unknown [Paenibacillus alginolyticus]
MPLLTRFQPVDRDYAVHALHSFEHIGSLIIVALTSKPRLRRSPQRPKSQTDRQQSHEQSRDGASLGQPSDVRLFPENDADGLKSRPKAENDHNASPKAIRYLLQTLVTHQVIPPKRIQRPRNIHAAVYYGYYAATFFLELRSDLRLSKYQSEHAIKIEEYAPLVRPTSFASANSLIDSLPKMYKQPAAMRTTRTVLMFRAIVCQILSFTSATRSSSVFSFAKRKFSRIRSKITILSLIE